MYNCPNCGQPVNDNDVYCNYCNCSLQYNQQYSPNYTPPYNPNPAHTPTQNQASSYENRLMSPWGYIGYSLLFTIPIVGFILIIVFSCNSSYKNRRNFARSYLYSLLLGLGIGVATFLVMFLTVGSLF